MSEPSGKKAVGTAFDSQWQDPLKTARDGLLARNSVVSRFEAHLTAAHFRFCLFSRDNIVRNSPAGH